MLKNNYFDHNSQDGTSVRPDDGGRVQVVGRRENIAAGQPTPQAVVTSWMNSPGHRANILNCGLKDLGVATPPAAGRLRPVLGPGLRLAARLSRPELDARIVMFAPVCSAGRGERGLMSGEVARRSGAGWSSAAS